MRIIEIVLTDLASKKLQAEESLQRVINDKTIPVDKQLCMINGNLKEIVELEQMILKWRSYTTQDTNEKNNE